MFCITSINGESSITWGLGLCSHHGISDSDSLYQFLGVSLVGKDFDTDSGTDRIK